ncbi:MAG: hypothetical protein NVS3B19_12220 [Ginsengibacter sp.]
MQELLNKLQNEHGLSAEQSSGILNTVANFIKEKVPMAAGMIDSYFPQGGTATANADGTSNQNESTLGKLEDFAKSKLGGMFGK